MFIKHNVPRKGYNIVVSQVTEDRVQNKVMCVMTRPLTTWGWGENPFTTADLYHKYIVNKYMQRGKTTLIWGCGQVKAEHVVERKWMNVSRRFWSRERLDLIKGPKERASLEESYHLSETTGKRGRMWSEMAQKDSAWALEMDDLILNPSSANHVIYSWTNYLTFLCLRGPICQMR